MIDWNTWLGTLVATVLAFAAVAVVYVVARLIVAGLAGRFPWMRELFDSTGPRLVVFLSALWLWAACAFTAPRYEPWWPAVSHVFLIAVIITGAWYISALATFGITRLMLRFDGDGATSVEMRRMRTQLSVVRRLIAVTIAVLAIGAVLFTFPEVRAVGASVLASAGIVSIVAGLAAQSTLGNLIAGIQLAFSNAVRVGDVVVIEGEWGRIGEITLSYVVVYIWDERRLVLPCTYFTSQPFEVWTRKGDRVLGTVYMDLDWRVPLAEVREKFQSVVEASEYWDKRASSVLVTDARGGYVTVRFLVSAANSGDQWNLRCVVREEMVTWLQNEHPHALPVTRVRVEEPAPSTT